MVAAALLGLLMLGTSIARAEQPAFPGLPELGGLAGGGPSDPQIAVEAQVQLEPDGTRGQLSVTARLGDGWHIYSLTQPPGGPQRTRIVLDSSSDYTLLGPFKPKRPAKVRHDKIFDMPVEEHSERITWTAPIRLQADTAGSVTVRGKIDGQICHDQGGCVPLSILDTKFVARVAGEAPRAREPSGLTASLSAATPQPLLPVNQAPGDGYRNSGTHATLHGAVTPAVARPGQTVQVTITAQLDEGWHIYAYEPQETQGIAKPTLITITKPSDWQFSLATPSQSPHVKATGLKAEPEQRYHEKSVRWTIDVTIPSDVQAGTYPLRGLIGYQTCTDAQCDMPTGAMFETSIQVGSGGEGAAALQFSKTRYRAVSQAISQGTVPTEPSLPRSAPLGQDPDVSFDLSQIVVTDLTARPIWHILFLAFLGGFVLNFMPCVLPVIGLKIMAFVQQAGESRSRVFALNAWYSFGMLSIFLVLATLASAASLGLSEESLGWGEQFNHDGFTIPLLAVVFVMGLSFLGVWELPIPGFAGTGKATDLAQREGFSGAFFKGVVTTILATPCSGPGLATALAWTATQPPSMVYLVFTFMGLGMAMPYLVLGVFPNLVRFIPKPGPWMDTFKQLMGFVLLGTVVYMFTLISVEYLVPTIALIFALWAACWWIGRTPMTASLARRVRAYVAAAAFAGVVGWFAFGYQGTNENELPWQPFSLATLDELTKANKTVLVDFTADW